jgi:hypothetical protein
LTITPTLSAERQAWDVTSLVTADVMTFGWAGFLLRATDKVEGLHDLTCTREPMYPVLTIS